MGGVSDSPLSRPGQEAGGSLAFSFLPGCIYLEHFKMTEKQGHGKGGVIIPGLAITAILGLSPLRSRR